MAVSFHNLRHKWETTTSLTFQRLTGNQLNENRLLIQFAIYDSLGEWLMEVNRTLFHLSDRTCCELKGKISSVNGNSSLFFRTESKEEADILRLGVMIAAYTISKNPTDVDKEPRNLLLTSAEKLAVSMDSFEAGLKEHKSEEEMVLRVVGLEKSYCDFAEVLIHLEDVHKRGITQI